MSLRILMVEDNEMNSELARVLLSVDGHNVEIARSASELRARLEKGGAPDIILMDILLGDGNGVDLLPEVRAKPDFQSVPVVALTAQALVDDGPRFLAAGFTAVITKPINTRTFASEVDRWARETVTR